MSSLKILFLFFLLFAVTIHTVNAQDENDEGEEECPQYWEDRIVLGHHLTFFPCCLAPGTVCQPASGLNVCGELSGCQGEGCLISFASKCEACTTPGIEQYANRACPTTRKCPPDTFPDPFGGEDGGDGVWKI